MISDEEILQEVETVDGFTKYFFYNVASSSVETKIYYSCNLGTSVHILVGNVFIYCCFAPFYTVLLSYTGTQFKLISSIIREMDGLMCRVENSGNILHEVPEQRFTAETKTSQVHFNHYCQKKSS
jgi:hypothetical protein